MNSKNSSQKLHVVDIKKQEPVEQRYNKVESLKRSIKFTADSRFIASRRLKRWNMWYLVAVNLASVVATVYTIIPKFLTEFPISQDKIDVIIITYSLIFLVLSLIISSLDFNSASKRHHECAIKLNHLLRRISFSSKLAASTPFKWLEEYHGILSEYENHAPSDYKWAIIDQDEKDDTESQNSKRRKSTLTWNKFYFPRRITIVVGQSYIHVGLLYLVLFFPVVLPFIEQMRRAPNNGTVCQTNIVSDSNDVKSIKNAGKK